MKQNTNADVDEFKNAIESDDDYDAIWVADADEREGYVTVEYDERGRSQKQITDLQKAVKSTVPVHENVEVDFADITTNQIRFTTN